jgi:hypothetical protein
VANQQPNERRVCVAKGWSKQIPRYARVRIRHTRPGVVVHYWIGSALRDDEHGRLKLHHNSGVGGTAMGSAKRIGRIGGLAVALGIGAGLAAAPWAAIAEPGGCSSNCSVGAFGTANSENAQGGYFTREESRVFPGSSVRSAGTEISGLLRLTAKEEDAVEGSVIGHVGRNGPMTNTGRVTGDLVVQDNDPNTPVVFSCSGQCEWQEP